MLEKDLRDILVNDKWDKDTDIGDNIQYTKKSSNEFLMILNESILYLMGDEFHIYTIPKFRNNGNATKLVKKYMNFMEGRCGEKDNGWTPYISCTTDNNTVIRILESLGWKYTDTLYTKSHGGIGGIKDKKWRYFYE